MKPSSPKESNSARFLGESFTGKLDAKAFSNLLSHCTIEGKVKKPILARGGVGKGMVEIMEFATGWTEGHTKSFLKSIGFFFFFFFFSFHFFPFSFFLFFFLTTNNYCNKHKNRKTFSPKRCLQRSLLQNFWKFRLPRKCLRIPFPLPHPSPPRSSL